MWIGHHTGLRFRGNKQVYTVDVSHEVCKIDEGLRCRTGCAVVCPRFLGSQGT